MLGPARKGAPDPIALGTFHQLPHILLYCSVIFRSQLKVGGQAGPGGKKQSEWKRTYFHCLLYELKKFFSRQDTEFAMQLPPLR